MYNGVNFRLDPGRKRVSFVPVACSLHFVNVLRFDVDIRVYLLGEKD